VNIEGKGTVCPTLVKIDIPASCQKWLAEIAAKREARKGYAASQDKWRQGMKHNAVLNGLWGECGCVLELARNGLICSWNPHLQWGGDGGADIKVKGIGIDVKTGVSWIRRIDSKGNIIPLCDIYVFASAIPDKNLVALKGWLFREKLWRVGEVRPQGHRNIEVDGNEMEPMHRLVTHLRS